MGLKADDGSTQPEAEAAPARVPSRGCLWAGVAIGLVLIAGLVLAAVWLRGATVPVTRARLAAAEARWRAAGIRSYSMELIKTGAVAERQRVEVDRGSVTLLRQDGTVMHPRDPSFYTVEGLFRTIREELAAADHPERMGLPAGSTVVLRMYVNPRYGYPDQFRRLVTGITGRDITVRITDFRPRTAGAAHQ